ncbi:PqqD family protein [Lutimaribacter sp. EGI FJ00015]|uniref:PqqD family protein n=1 Tax=Lutimaribacter degradans TaxID=2945989 RepID=A0ACC6A0V9_9RHOB|nr:PqqD family protein [Lutimaribacter sp. EGI FJ00013]MCM2563631.1 PqqD family protein [Lutimaribacter sp. EGI FJ00013]MCO0614833.1 PqqD family protein [Lutimaribacter sp. EGI FJ00015]MCO0637483.1 PqqD family protein [Lutimaribacter sp. EGI FJ00014]
MAENGQNKPAAEARRTRASVSRATRLSFAGLSHEVELRESDEIHESLRKTMPGWRPALQSVATTRDAPHSAIWRGSDGRFSFQSWWGESPLKGLGLAGATCGAVADLIQSYLDERPGTLGLHCGAVRIGIQLVAFTGPYRAGKSTLVTRLGAEPDCALFCDDILPIEPDGTALALGVQPRLRLPLPDGISSGFRDYVARAKTIHDHRYAFVSDPQQAALGTSAPLSAMVVLCRKDGARARFHQLDTSDAAAFVIRQNIADPGDADSHYDRIEGLVENLVCLTLVYSDLEEAVALIRDTFGQSHVPDLQESLAPPLMMNDPADAAEPADLRKEFARAEDVVMRRIGSDMFLWQMETRSFFRLNHVGGAVWILLETRQPGSSIVATLEKVFPHAPAQVVEHDVAKLLGQLQKRGLVDP